MESFSLQEIIKAAGGTLLKGSLRGETTGISIDSRTINYGELFVAIKGNNFDGHDFVGQALEKGASGIVISSEKRKELKVDQLIKNFPRMNIFQAENTLEALQNIAYFNRRKYSIPIIGITGSNGKTTTKEMVASILSRRFKVLKTEGNLNNLIGVPLTLLRMNSKHQIAVIEMGMNAKGEIERLSKITEPNIGIITNINLTHVDTLKNIEEVAMAKWELVEGLKKEGLMILNADDPHLMKLKTRLQNKLWTFGINSQATFMAKEIISEGIGGMLFTFCNHNRKRNFPVHLSLVGEYNVYSALAAGAVAKALEMDETDIKTALHDFCPVKFRMNIIETKMGITILNDAYNANPQSMRGAIQTLLRLRQKGKAIVVMGNMLELGEYTEDEHRKIGKFIVQSEVDILITLGKLAELAASEALEKGMSDKNIFVCQTHKEIRQILKDKVQKGDYILVKGSREMMMERVVEDF